MCVFYFFFSIYHCTHATSMYQKFTRILVPPSMTLPKMKVSICTCICFYIIFLKIQSLTISIYKLTIQFLFFSSSSTSNEQNENEMPLDPVRILTWTTVGRSAGICHSFHRFFSSSFFFHHFLFNRSFFFLHTDRSPLSTLIMPSSLQ